MYVIAELRTPQKIPSQIKASKKCMETFSAQKIPKLQNRKFQTPKKSFDHPRHLKSGVPSGQGS